MTRGMLGRAGRTAVTGMLLGLAIVGAHANGQSQSTVQQQGVGHEQFNGFWRIERPVFALLTDKGKAPPLKASARRTYMQRQAARRQGDTSFDGATWCASLGYPRALLVDYPFQLIVRPQQAVFLHEWNWWHNIVYFDGSLSAEDVSVGPAGVNIDVPGAIKVRPEDIPGSMGFSMGSWVGNTLTVRTGKTVDTTLLDSAGLPHSDDLKITTTWRLRSPDILEARFRFEDPATFTRPWETVVTFSRQSRGWEQEDVCLDRIKAGQVALKEVAQ